MNLRNKIKKLVAVVTIIMLAPSNVFAVANLYDLNLIRASTQYASITDALGIDGGAQTASMWINLDSLPASGEQFRFYGQQNSGTDTTFQFMYYNNAGTKQLWATRGRFGIAYVSVIYNVDLTTGTWYHVVGRYTGSNVELYLDGSLVAGPTAASGNGSGAGSGTSIGGFDGEGGGSTFTVDTTKLFDGQIDDVIVFSASISTTRISDLLNTPCTPDLTNAVARWEFENDLTDSVASFDLTGSGSPTFNNSGLPYACASPATPPSQNSDFIFFD